MMNADSHAASAESIAHALEYEVETLTQVVETLDIEHEALMGSDAERLEQAVAAKQRQRHSMAKLHKKTVVRITQAYRDPTVSAPETCHIQSESNARRLYN